VAAVNSATSVVISGEWKALSKVIRALPSGTKNTRVKATHADHSPLMTAIAEQLETKARSLYGECAPSSPTCLFASTVTGDMATPELLCQPSYWADHATGCVLFTKALDSILAAGRERAAARESPFEAEFNLHFVEMGEGMLERCARDGFSSYYESETHTTAANVYAHSVLEKFPADASKTFEELASVHDERKQQVMDLVRAAKLQRFLLGVGQDRVDTSPAAVAKNRPAASATTSSGWFF